MDEDTKPTIADCMESIKEYFDGNMTSEELIDYMDIRPTETSDSNMTIRGMKKSRSAKCRTTGGSHQISFTANYDGMVLNDVLDLATSTITINGQRAWEKLSPKELLDKVDGKTFDARTIGHKIKSKDEQIAGLEVVFINAGLSPEKARALAIAGVEHPESLKVEETE